LARNLLRAWVQTRFSAQLAQVNAGLHTSGALYLFGLRLIPLVPFMLINLTLGVTHMRSWTFYWVSQLGMLASTAIYVNAGIQLAELQSLADIASPPLLASLALIGVFPLAVRVVWLRVERFQIWRRS
jgi:uncharacterized membrane protein YdjX (TVP38/TMEM64 family)